MSTKFTLTLLYSPLLILSAPAPGQTVEDRLRSLSVEIEALKESNAAMRKELDSLRGLLKPAQPPPFKPVRLNIEAAPALGSATAKVTLVEFTDYQCGYCARHSRDTLPQIKKEYIDTGKVKYVLRDLPIETIHPRAFEAAQAAHCAGDQGRYWEMHDKLFGAQKDMSPEHWSKHASDLGVNVEQFSACLASGKHAAFVRKSIQSGHQSGARGTPAAFLGLTQPGSSEFTATIYINGAHPFSTFQGAIERLLNGVPEVAASGGN